MNLNMNLKDLRIDKNTIVIAVIIMITLFVASNIYKKGASSIILLKEKINTEINKNTVINDIGKTEKIIRAYKEEVNKKDISSVINTLGSIANKFGIKIISVKPARTEDFPVFTKYHFDLRCESGSYHSIGKFISNLESHPDVYCINTLSIKLAPNSGSKDQQSKFNVDLSLNTIIVKG